MSFNRNSSFPSNLDKLSPPVLSKSPSLESFLNIRNTIVIDFEGDGELGIEFKLNGDDIIVHNIKKDCVANEYYDLEIGYSLIRVNSFHKYNFTNKELFVLLNRIWCEASRIEMEFIKKINPVKQFLDSCSCSEYYYIFLELGAKELIDLDYIEYLDLMDIPRDKRIIICSKLNIKEPDI